MLPSGVINDDSQNPQFMSQALQLLNTVLLLHGVVYGLFVSEASIQKVSEERK